MQLEIAKNGYIHIFTSSEISFSRKFKKNIFDNSLFMDFFYLLIINKIHLIKKQDKGYQLLNDEI